MLTSRPVTFAAAGHPAVTGRHGKTLEVTAEPHVTGRATCVIGTGARIPVDELRRLRGRVRVELSCDELRDEVEGEVNPHYAAPDRWVARRSAVLAPDTFLVNASRSAADLDRSLVRALADPSATLQVVVRELAIPDPVVLVIVGDAVPAALPPELAPLADQVDEVVNLAAPGRHGSGARRTTAVLVRTLSQARGVGQLVGHADRPVRVAIWPPAPPGTELLVAAGEATDPLLYAGVVPGRSAARRELARLIEQGGQLAAVAARPEDPQATLDLVGLLPGHAVLLPDPSVGWGVAVARLDPPRSVAGERLLAGLGGLERHPVLVFVPPRRGDRLLIVHPDRLAELLRGAGLSGRSIRDVVGALGGDRRRVYSRSSTLAVGVGVGATDRNRGHGLRRAPGSGL